MRFELSGEPWFRSELRILRVMLDSEDVTASRFVRDDLKVLAKGDGSRKAITHRVNNLFAYLDARGAIARTQTHVTVLDYDELRKIMAEGRPNPRGRRV